MKIDNLICSDVVSQPLHFAIVGAGLIGRLIAWRLAQQGHQVTLLDKDSKPAKQSAAYAAAGLLTPLGEAMHSDANIVEMGFESLSLWPKLLAELSGYTYFQQSGAIMVSHEQDISDFQRYARYLANHYAHYQCHKMSREQLLALEPELGRSFHSGLYLPQEGQIGNRKLLIALQQELEKLAVCWLEHASVSGINQQSNTSVVQFTQQGQLGQINCDFVIDCRGSGARKSQCSKQAFALNDLRAVRGELFQLLAPDVHLTRPVRLMHPRYQLYIAPKTHGYYVVGATEIESEDNAPMTVRSSMELLSAAYSVHPGFAEANIRQHISQLRPAFSDNQPKILISERVLQVNGLYRHGFLIAPVVLQQVLYAIEQMTRDSAIEPDASPYGRWLTISARENSAMEKESYEHSY
ncbi:glycine oxidase ThiO [Thalassotalea insulae]|uniref:Glycine oxidase ThiO n=1 Tax=Thalassotalea insulae TaxID=2056778 RepID=A0ABQ6GQR9_9GAMM|nr:glycine oxidase ThiO [Thalassotalea insulae]GLX78308.1 glycine oxidase ThiO [Thalassotalea insulae]